jgi:hypothetical protein
VLGFKEISPDLNYAVVVFLLPRLSAAQGQNLEERVPRSTRLGIGVEMSLLGVGIEAATPPTACSNLRTAFHIFTYRRPFDTDGITYQGELDLRSA